MGRTESGGGDGLGGSEGRAHAPLPGSRQVLVGPRSADEEAKETNLSEVDAKPIERQAAFERVDMTDGHERVLAA